MAKTEQQLREDIIKVGQLVFQKGWVAANDGNISIRLGGGRFLCTPTGTCKGMMSVDDLIICDSEGKKLVGEKKPTTELAMHMTVYNMRPDINAVVHAHPPVATGYAAAGKGLNIALLPEVIIGLGCVPLAGYGLPGTSELTEPMLPYIPKYEALLMANHGAVCYGPDVLTAYFKMETVEHYARISLVAELLGGGKALPRTEVDKLLDARTRYGVKAQVSGEPGCPVAAEEIGGVAQGERFEVTREELIALVDQAVQARGLS